MTNRNKKLSYDTFPFVCIIALIALIMFAYTVLLPKTECNKSDNYTECTEQNDSDNNTNGYLLQQTVIVPSIVRHSFHHY